MENNMELSELIEKKKELEQKLKENHCIGTVVAIKIVKNLIADKTTPKRKKRGK